MNAGTILTGLGPPRTPYLQQPQHQSHLPEDHNGHEQEHKREEYGQGGEGRRPSGILQNERDRKGDTKDKQVKWDAITKGLNELGGGRRTSKAVKGDGDDSHVSAVELHRLEVGDHERNKTEKLRCSIVESKGDGITCANSNANDISGANHGHDHLSNMTSNGSLGTQRLRSTTVPISHSVPKPSYLLSPTSLSSSTSLLEVSTPAHPPTSSSPSPSTLPSIDVVTHNHPHPSIPNPPNTRFSVSANGVIWSTSLPIHSHLPSHTTQSLYLRDSSSLTQSSSTSSSYYHPPTSRPSATISNQDRSFAPQLSMLSSSSSTTRLHTYTHNSLHHSSSTPISVASHHSSHTSSSGISSANLAPPHTSNLFPDHKPRIMSQAERQIWLEELYSSRGHRDVHSTTTNTTGAIVSMTNQQLRSAGTMPTSLQSANPSDETNMRSSTLAALPQSTFRRSSTSQLPASSSTSYASSLTNPLEYVNFLFALLSAFDHLLSILLGLSLCYHHPVPTCYILLSFGSLHHSATFSFRFLSLFFLDYLLLLRCLWTRALFHLVQIVSRRSGMFIAYYLSPCSQLVTNVMATSS